MGLVDKIRGSKKGSIIVQFFENTVAYALPVFIQQFVVYPLMANKLGAETNGLFLALIALNYFVVNITASVLVNTRLLRKKSYEENGIKGDYNIFMLAFSIVDVLIIVAGTLFYTDGSVSFVDVFLSILLVILFIYHDYITVQYRSELRFANILINNVLICIGYFLGLVVLYYVFPHWQIVFIVPYLMTAVYDWNNTDYIKEPIRRTPLIKETARQYFILLGSTLLSTLVTYGDRLILYPLMDGTSVSIFSSAQLIGKMLQMVSTPVSTFMLAHLVNRKKIQLKLKATNIMEGIVALAVVYFLCVFISRPMLYYLYPGWAKESLNYVSLTAANGILHMLSVLLNVIVLRCCHSKWQIVKSAVYLISYMVLSFSLLEIWGLTGFCIGNLVASAIVVLLLIFLLFKDKVFVFGASRPIPNNS